MVMLLFSKEDHGKKQSYFFVTDIYHMLLEVAIFCHTIL